MIPYSRQHVSSTDVKNVNKVLRSNYLTQGPLVGEFEDELILKCKSKYAIALNSATSSLHVTCMALGLTKKKYLWTSPISFVASANCALYCGAKVDFVDIDNKTFNIDIKKLKEKLITAKKKNKLPSIIVPVHLAGNPCDMEEIFKLSKIYKFKIIEDASHALGSTYKSNIIGSCRHSTATVLSFHPIKSITSAEGGAVLTNDKKLMEKVKMLREHGITKNNKKFLIKNSGAWYYEQQFLGYNYRMSDVHAALGLSQIKNLKKFIKKRNIIANIYEKNLNIKGIKFQKKTENSHSSRHLFIIRVNKKIHKKLFNYLRNKGIYVNLHYIPIYRQPFYKKNFKINNFNFPNSESYYSEAISIPVYYDLKLSDQKRVIKNIKNFISLNEK
tara:strand:- start:38 stop:1198 length:1161 start_codon:yes stop_codon:yes gene_type:complete